MTKFLAYYIVADSQYKHGKLRYITGNDGFTPINDPANALDPPAGDERPGIAGLIDADKDRDTLVFSYINDEGAPEVLACNVFTPLPSPPDPDAASAPGTGNPLTSTGRYTILLPEPVSDTGIVKWYTLEDGKGKNIKLVAVDSGGGLVEVAGNPQAVVKIGGYLLILGYDSTIVYRVSIDSLKNTGADSACPFCCLVEEAIDLMAGPAGAITVGPYHHGTALFPMYDAANLKLYLFALFSNTAETDTGWVTNQYDSTLVRCAVGEDGDGKPTLTCDASALTAANATDMDKYTYNGEDYLLVGAIGGTQAMDNLTNAGLSCVMMVNAFAAEPDFDNMTEIIEGDGEDIRQLVSSTGTYDIHFLAVSDDGANALLGTLCYDEDGRACWRFYEANLAGIAARAIADPTSDVNISTLVGLGLLTEVDSGFQDEAGYYWEGAFLNAANQLWTMKGNEIRICEADDYGELIKKISGKNDKLYDSNFNINVLNMIGELLYPPEEPVSKDRALRCAPRLGKYRMLARAASAAAQARAQAKAAEEAAAKAAAAEEGKK